MFQSKKKYYESDCNKYMFILEIRPGVRFYIADAFDINSVSAERVRMCHTLVLRE